MLKFDFKSYVLLSERVICTRLDANICSKNTFPRFCPNVVRLECAFCFLSLKRRYMMTIMRMRVIKRFPEISTHDVCQRFSIFKRIKLKFGSCCGASFKQYIVLRFTAIDFIKWNIRIVHFLLLYSEVVHWCQNTQYQTWSVKVRISQKMLRNVATLAGLENFRIDARNA